MSKRPRCPTHAHTTTSRRAGYDLLNSTWCADLGNSYTIWCARSVLFHRVVSAGGTTLSRVWRATVADPVRARLAVVAPHITHDGTPPAVPCPVPTSRQDHHDDWGTTISNAFFLGSHPDFVGAQTLTWPDPDFLMTGGAGCNDLTPGVRCPGMSDDEYRSVLGHAGVRVC